MKRAPITILSVWFLWPIVIALGLGGYVVALAVVTGGVLRAFLLTAPAILCIACVYLAVRTLRFLARLRAFFRRLLYDDYNTGIRDITWISDGFTQLTELANRTADRLRTYDELRAERTGLSYRAMDMLFRISEQALILVDMEKKQFRLNPVAQKMYDVKQETYTFDSIEKQGANTRFFRIFLLAVLRETVTKEGTAPFKLPQRDTVLEIDFRLEPLKDRSEKVRYAFVIFRSSEESRSDSPVSPDNGQIRNENTDNV